MPVCFQLLFQKTVVDGFSVHNNILIGHSMESFLQEALLSFSAIDLLFLSSLSVVFLFRPHFPFLEL